MTGGGIWTKHVPPAGDLLQGMWIAPHMQDEWFLSFFFSLFMCIYGL